MTLLGLVSDTHDNTLLAAQAASFFRERRVDGVFHMGDVTSPDSLDPFEGLPLVVVRGNNDEEPWPETWRQSFDGLALGATHGHQRAHLATLMDECDVVLHGHTHRRRAERVGRALIVNPGALHRAPQRTCALLELPSKRVVFYEVVETGVRRL
ncbi:MAG TPA: YfcE family phosphodiesterase [Candidatus Thermoplasmatota archaeon]|nr:YfcE family phosphodiesterase [Candidatus Thermoplasmatota archaeon]